MKSGEDTEDNASPAPESAADTNATSNPSCDAKAAEQAKLDQARYVASISGGARAGQTRPSEVCIYHFIWCQSRPNWNKQGM